MRKSWPLGLILITYFAVGALYAVRIPAWQGPDEPAHYNYTRQLEQTGRLPVIEAGDWDALLVPIAPDNRNVAVERITYEDHQPPLFYALAEPLFAVSHGDLVVLRLFSLAVGAITVVMAYACVVAIFPGAHHPAAFAATLVALLPQHLYMMSAFNNDSLSEALLAVALWLCIKRIVNPPQPADARRMLGLDPALIVLGITVGACMLTKAQAYLSLPLAAVAVAWFCGARTVRAHLNAISMVVLAAVLPAMWWGRNAAIYGGLDVLGLQRHNAVVAGQLTTAQAIAERGLGGWLGFLLQTTFQSFWGQFGWMSIPLNDRVYAAMLLFTFATGAVFVAWWLKLGRKRGTLLIGGRQAGGDATAPALDPRAWPAQSLRKGGNDARALTLMAVLMAMTLAAFAWYNAQFVQAQGRYIFPALIPVSTAAALGWSHAAVRWPRAQRWLWPGLLMGFATLDVYLLLRVILPAMRAQ